MPERTSLEQRYDLRRAKRAGARARLVVNLIDAGRTYADVARMLGISPQRVHAIVKRWEPERFWREK